MKRDVNRPAHRGVVAYGKMNCSSHFFVFQRIAGNPGAVERTHAELGNVAAEGADRPHADGNRRQ